MYSYIYIYIYIYIYYLPEPLAHNCEPVRGAGRSQVLIALNSVVSENQTE